VERTSTASTAGRVARRGVVSLGSLGVGPLKLLDLVQAAPERFCFGEQGRRSVNSVPPNVEWKQIDRGDAGTSFKKRFVNRKTLVLVLNILMWTVKLARTFQKLVDGV